MRVLLRDKTDSALFVAQVECAGYDPEDGILWFQFPDGWAEIPMAAGSANAFLKDLYHEGFCNLSAAFATIEWEDDI